MKIFSEVFTISEVDPDGAVFPEVCRLLLKSESSSMYLDCYTPGLKYKKMDVVEVAIFSNENGFSEKDIHADYTYLMGNGVIYLKENKERSQYVEISFSGLLAALTTPENRIKEEDRYKRLFIGISQASAGVAR